MAGCSRKEEKTLDRVTVQLVGAHSSRFAGLYAAEQKGFYAEEGIEVTLQPCNDTTAATISTVIDGRADFGIHRAGALLNSVAQGSAITIIAVIFQHDPRVFITLPESGITRPQKFPGHTIRALAPGTGQISWQAMMSRLDLDPGSVQQIEAGFDLSPFLKGDIDIWPCYLTDEVLALREQGYEVNVILPDNYGVHLYGDSLFAGDKLIEEDPDLVLRFLRATVRGWQWAIKNIEEAGMLALTYDPTLDISHQAAVIRAGSPLIYNGEGPIGSMRADVWQEMQRIFSEQGILVEPVDPDRVYTMKFLQKIYEEDKNETAG
jgi:ABC-type nitrate/sulfonate/bicarbonate transport system substrate-binding protein